MEEIVYHLKSRFLSMNSMTLSLLVFCFDDDTRLLRFTELRIFSYSLFQTESMLW